MKKSKALKITLIILIIILLSIISFVGIYVQKKGVMENILPEYFLSRDLSGYRMVELKVSDDTTKVNYDAEGNEIPSTDTTTEIANSEEKAINSEEELTKENYKIVKKMVKERINSMQGIDYLLRQNEENGTIILELPENDNTDRVVGEVATVGKFEIVDKDTDEVLMKNDDIESVEAGYGTNASGETTVFMNIQFNKEGTQKFKDITNKYVQTTVTKENETTENEETVQEETDGEEEETAKEDETETITKQIVLKIDDNKLLETYFEQEVSNGLMQLSLGSSSKNSTEKLQEYLIEATNMATVLNSGKMPIIYEIEQNEYIAPSITEKNIKTVVLASIVVFALGLCIISLKYKTKGILASISLIGYIAILLIAIRYLNVQVSLEGIITLLFSVCISYAIAFSILKQNQTIKAIGKWTKLLIPTLIIAITFVFNNILIGTVLFWGVALALLYHISITNLLLKD